MYDNIGRKIKGLAEFSFFAGTLCCALVGIYYIMNPPLEMAPLGLLIIIVGALVSWISSWVVYGFGELIDKACDIERNTRKDEKSSETQPAIDYEEIIKLEKLHSQGFLTDEEYQKFRTEILNKL